MRTRVDREPDWDRAIWGRERKERESGTGTARGRHVTETLEGANVLELRKMLAGSTGLEPAASGVTGRRSNQLNYDP